MGAGRDRGQPAERLDQWRVHRRDVQLAVGNCEHAGGEVEVLVERHALFGGTPHRERDMRDE